MRAHRVLRFIQQKRKRVSFGTGLALAALATQSAAAVVPSNTYTTWVAPARGFTNMSWTVRPEVDPSPQPFFWSHQWFMDNGTGSDTAGYAGLQTVGTGFGGKIAIFSIWDSLAGTSSTPGSQCVVFGGEGTGYSCRIPFDWQTGRTYTFNLSRVQPAVWEVTVTDQTNNITSSIGQITVPATWGALADQSIAFTEYYGPSLTTCASANYSRAQFGAPTYQTGSQTPVYNVNQTAANECQGSSKVSALPAQASYHEINPAFGVKGEYYKSNSLSNLGLTRTDPTINFNWGSGAPGSGFSSNNFSTRWTGKFQASQTALHNFCASFNDGARLWVNGVQLVSDWKSRGSAVERCGSIQLTMGQFYDLKMEYVEFSGSASAKLSYSTVATPKTVIPTGMYRIK